MSEDESMRTSQEIHEATYQDEEGEEGEEEAAPRRSDAAAGSLRREQQRRPIIRIFRAKRIISQGSQKRADRWRLLSSARSFV